MGTFLDLVRCASGSNPATVLDVGGTEDFWVRNWSLEFNNLHVTLLNLTRQQLESNLPIISLAGDARAMRQFHNAQFDICFSNSVIEHVGTLADQLSMANEVRRVAKAYFVQTPYRYFPIEPHYHFPCWAQLPVGLRTVLHRRFDLGWLQAEPDYLKARIDVEGIRLLSLREYRLAFPDAHMHLEKIGPLVKSLIAIRRDRAS